MYIYGYSPPLPWLHTTYFRRNQFLTSLHTMHTSPNMESVYTPIISQLGHFRRNFTKQLTILQRHEQQQIYWLARTYRNAESNRVNWLLKWPGVVVSPHHPEHILEHILQLIGHSALSFPRKVIGSLLLLLRQRHVTILAWINSSSQISKKKQNWKFMKS